MLKSYEEMRKIDVTPYCEERDGMAYLNWAKCIDLLHENGAQKVFWIPIPDEKTGNSLRMSDVSFEDKNKVTNRCYETRIKVVIDDNEYEFQSPVMNGSNPVKDNSMSQQRVWNSMCRSFVKCVAIHTGLGFNLWLKEEYNPYTAMPMEDSKPSKTQLKVLEDICVKNHVSLDAWLIRQERTRDTVTADEVAKMLRAMQEKYGE